jgi:hypothetical protein
VSGPQRQPPQLIGLGPDSTPPSGAETGTVEQRLGAGIEGVHADVRDLKIAIGVVSVDAGAARLGVDHVHAAVQELRDRTEVLERAEEGRARAQHDQVDELSQEMTRQLSAMRATTATVSRRAGAVIGRVDQLAREQRETRDDVELLKDSVSALVDVVGKPPQTEALARASSQDLSPAAVEALDLGTGLHRMITRLAVDNIQAARRAGRREGTKGAVVGGGVTAIAVAAITHADKLEHLMRSLLGG